MTGILESQRFWKRGGHSHVWVVDAIIPAKSGHPAVAVLVNEDGRVTEDVDLSHSENPNLYTPAR